MNDPTSSAAPEPAGDVFELITQDHRHVQQLFRSYQGTSDADTKLSVAREICTTVARHASAEERLIYPLIKTVIPDYQANRMLYDMMCTDDQVLGPLSRSLTEDEKSDLYLQFQSALKNAPLHPHPEGPTNALPSKIVHPVVGAVDRATHAVTGFMHKALHIDDKAKAAAYQGTETGRQHTPSA